jgi:hypothetical protein
MATERVKEMETTTATEMVTARAVATAVEMVTAKVRVAITSVRSRLSEAVASC